MLINSSNKHTIAIKTVLPQKRKAYGSIFCDIRMPNSSQTFNYRRHIIILRWYFYRKSEDAILKSLHKISFKSFFLQYLNLQKPLLLRNLRQIKKHGKSNHFNSNTKTLPLFNNEIVKNESIKTQHLPYTCLLKE